MCQYDNKIQLTGERRDARAYNSFGNSAEGYNKKDYNIAIEEFSKVINNFPNTPESKNSLFMISYYSYYSYIFNRSINFSSNS